jgi:hypothetical protein
MRREAGRAALAGHNHLVHMHIGRSNRRTSSDFLVEKAVATACAVTDIRPEREWRHRGAQLRQRGATDSGGGAVFIILARAGTRSGRASGRALG